LHFDQGNYHYIISNPNHQFIAFDYYFL